IDKPLSRCRSGGRHWQRRLRINDIRLLRAVFKVAGDAGALVSKQLAKRPLALDRQPVPIRIELVPNLLVGATDAAQPLHASLLVGRIERSEIAQFHRHRARSPPDDLGQIDDPWIPSVTLPEAQLAIEIESGNQLHAGPVAVRHSSSLKNAY